MAARLLLAAVLCAAMLAPAIGDDYPADARLYASDTWQQEGFTMTVRRGAGMGGDWFFAELQSDCNLVLNHEDRVYWATGTNTAGQHLCYLAMQRDGNLVIYGDHSNAVWASNSPQSTLGEYYVQIQVDGNLVIYSEAGAPIWASGSNYW